MSQSRQPTQPEPQTESPDPGSGPPLGWVRVGLGRGKPHPLWAWAAQVTGALYGYPGVDIGILGQMMLVVSQNGRQAALMPLDRYERELMEVEA